MDYTYLINGLSETNKIGAVYFVHCTGFKQAVFIIVGLCMKRIYFAYKKQTCMP